MSRDREHMKMKTAALAEEAEGADIETLQTLADELKHRSRPKALKLLEQIEKHLSDAEAGTSQTPLVDTGDDFPAVNFFRVPEDDAEGFEALTTDESIVAAAMEAARGGASDAVTPQVDASYVLPSFVGAAHAADPEVRSLEIIAHEIARDWCPVNFGAEPYLKAMGCLDSIEDNFGCDSARSIVNYFLSNANTWRGETARRVKAELRGMVRC